MKKLLSILVVNIFLVFAIGVFTSCEGPQGPEGPEGPKGETGATGDTGPQGPQGEPGEDGTDGVDGADGAPGTALCMECHDNDVMDAIKAEYYSSGHAAGAASGYAGGRSDCAKCHSNQGAVAFFGGETITNYDNPAPISCGACHTHDYDATTQEMGIMSSTEAVTAIMDDQITLDFGDASNLCANCHQPRRSGPDVTDGSAAFSITSSHWGPHHGPQATLLEGVGGYEYEGTINYPTGYTSHRENSSCVECHMIDGVEGAGGHTWHPSIEACTDCHSGATDFESIGTSTSMAVIEGLLHELALELETAGIVVEVDGAYHLPDDDKAYPIATTNDVAGCYFNYIMVEEDRSLGVHNPAYCYALLKNSIECMKAYNAAK